jgi:hypothetical protein
MEYALWFRKVLPAPLVGLFCAWLFPFSGFFCAWRLSFSGFWVILDYNSTFYCNGPHANLLIQLNIQEFLQKNDMVGIYGNSHN